MLPPEAKEDDTFGASAPARTVDAPEETKPSCWSRACGARLEKKTGAWYWRRERLTTVVASMAILCVVGDALLASAAPYVIRQAHKTLGGLQTLTEITATATHLHSVHLRELEEVFGRKTRIVCEANALDDTMAEFRHVCDMDLVNHLRLNVNGFFDAVDDWASEVEQDQLNCSREMHFWDMGAGWFGDAFGCRLTCNLNDWARSARVTVNEEWGPDSALDFPLELSLAVKAVTDQIVELEALINDALAVIGVGSWEDDELQENAERVVQFRKTAMDASKGLEYAIDCFETLGATLAPASDDALSLAPTVTPAPTANGTVYRNSTYTPCRLKKEFKSLSDVYGGYREVMKISTQLLDFVHSFSRFLEHIPDWLVSLLVAFCILPHVLISIFIHRVVYKREVDKMWFLGCAAVEARCCPNRYARRVVESERRYNDSVKDPQTGERPPMPKRRASKKLAVAKAAVCDESYVVRFWLLYATANFLLLFALGIVMFLLVLVFLTDDVAMCSFLYRKSQPVKAAVRKMLRTARGSCFRHEARTARHIRGFSNHDVDVQCNANTHGLNAEMKVLVPIAATFLLVGNWFLCQWMPAHGPRRNHEASPRPRPASTFRDDADPPRRRLAASPRLAVDVPRTKSNREASLLRRN